MNSFDNYYRGLTRPGIMDGSGVLRKFGIPLKILEFLESSGILESLEIP